MAGMARRQDGSIASNPQPIQDVMYMYIGLFGHENGNNNHDMETSSAFHQETTYNKHTCSNESCRVSQVQGRSSLVYTFMPNDSLPRMWGGPCGMPVTTADLPGLLTFTHGGIGAWLQKDTRKRMNQNEQRRLTSNSRSCLSKWNGCFAGACVPNLQAVRKKNGSKPSVSVSPFKFRECPA